MNRYKEHYRSLVSDRITIAEAQRHLSDLQGDLSWFQERLEYHQANIATTKAEILATEDYIEELNKRLY